MHFIMNSNMRFINNNKANVSNQVNPTVDRFDHADINLRGWYVLLPGDDRLRRDTERVVKRPARLSEEFLAMYENQNGFP